MLANQKISDLHVAHPEPAFDGAPSTVIYNSSVLGFLIHIPVVIAEEFAYRHKLDACDLVLGYHDV